MNFDIWKAQRDIGIRETKRVCQASERRGTTPWRAVSKQMMGDRNL